MNDWLWGLLIVGGFMVAILISDSLRYLVTELRFLSRRLGDMHGELGAIHKELNSIATVLTKRTLGRHWSNSVHEFNDGAARSAPVGVPGRAAKMSDVA